MNPGMSTSDRELVDKWLSEIEIYRGYHKEDEIATGLIRPLLSALKSHERRISGLYRMLDEVPTKKRAAEIATEVVKAVTAEAPLIAASLSEERIKEIVHDELFARESDAVDEDGGEK